MQNDQRRELAPILECIVERNGMLGQQVIALTMICSYLLAERCAMASDPKAALLKAEGELGGTAEAIALRAHSYSDINVDTREVTRTVDTVLNQARVAIERGR
jgi:hypothetical protein